MRIDKTIGHCATVNTAQSGNDGVREEGNQSSSIAIVVIYKTITRDSQSMEEQTIEQTSARRRS